MPIPDHLLPQWLLDLSAPFVIVAWLLVLATPFVCVLMFVFPALWSGVSTSSAPEQRSTNE